MTARMGATPVPGPTHMTGVVGSGGRERRPFLSPMRSLSPSDRRRENASQLAQNSATAAKCNVPGPRPARYRVHTPRLGIFSRVLYCTVAMHKCICRGCFWMSHRILRILFSSDKHVGGSTHFDRTSDRELPRTHRREQVKDILLWDTCGSELFEDLSDRTTRTVAILIQLILCFALAHDTWTVVRKVSSTHSTFDTQELVQLLPLQLVFRELSQKCEKGPPGYSCDVEVAREDDPQSTAGWEMVWEGLIWHTT